MDSDLKEKKARRVERRKGQIIAAAKEVFAQNGYRRTTIEEIADVLGVGKGTLYRYFDDKKALFLAVFEEGMVRLMQTVRAEVDGVEDPRGKIAAAVRTYFKFFDDDRELIEIVMQVRSEFKDDYQREYLAMYSDYIVRIQQNLRRGIELGIFREMDVERSAEAVSAALQGVLQSFYVRRPNEKLVDRIEAVSSLILFGLTKSDGVRLRDFEERMI